MKLQTQIPLQKQSINQIDYTSNIILLGSCFSENIGDKFAFYKFQSVQNPFGILFHPKAIENLISNAINLKEYTEDDIFFLNERWHCFEAHSSVSTENKEELLNNLNSSISRTLKQLKQSSHIVITLGTAWTYRHITSDTTVANCHKVPQKKFLKELLPVDEITENLDAIVSLIKSVNPNASTLFTVSPVRHLKDGFIQNQQSKSHLISAVHQVINSRNVSYFPSYEIMMDELRDYRFYAEDMIHPNQTAINYIWERFSEVWVSDKAKKTMQEVANIQNGLLHRPFNPNSTQHQQFLENLSLKIEKLQKEYPFIHF
jgi:lysophospholipase L1-like esterase